MQINQNHNDSTSHVLEGVSVKRQEITCVGEDVKKREHESTVGGSVNLYSHYKKEHGGQNIKNRTNNYQ